MSFSWDADIGVNVNRKQTEWTDARGGALAPALPLAQQPEKSGERWSRLCRVLRPEAAASGSLFVRRQSIRWTASRPHEPLGGSDRQGAWGGHFGTMTFSPLK
jgi:hypothetical protein